ncbi:unnamed protein product [Ambrosiozyma monospora]|uniref:Unnamed protein product n=1 Tax=Ambrosiozyma monospora TaxID=43982 RepID=A0ACB5SRW7_AMBMO|nr:unnamed protein product [Ambrosiozyma monospora]
MDLIQQVQGRRASYIEELLLLSKEANPNTKHVKHDLFSIQLQVLTNSFVRRQAVWWSIEHQIDQEFEHVDSTDISFERIVDMGDWSSKRSPLILLVGATLKNEELMKLNRFLFCLVKQNCLKFSKIEYRKPNDPPPVILQDRDIALMLQRISNDSSFWLNR